MKNKTNLLSFLSIVLSSITAIFVAYYSYSLNLFTNLILQRQTNDKEAILNIIENVYMYRTPYTIDYENLDKVFYTSYTCTDPLWVNEREYDLTNTDLNLHDACSSYDQIAKMRNDFQRKTVKARVLGSSELNLALDDIESGFDEVFDYYITHDYYLRAFPDAYLAVMPAKFDRLVEVAKNELGTK